MTQEVQPLTWSKRTNIEEHQQFFAKINEIIGNLAPTVDEAEQAIAQATAAIASANDAVATANAASAAASAAASQAQTAASTVAGYDGRLTAAEGDIDTLQAADQTMAGNISALGTRMTAAESKNSQQDTAIAALQNADAQNVKINRINEYAVGLTGNQDILGNKNFKGLITVSMSRIGATGSSGYTIVYRFKNAARVQTLLVTGGRTIIMAQVSAAGGYKGQLFTSGRDYKTPSWMWVVTDAVTGDHYLVTQGLYSATMNIHVINSFQYGNVYPYQDDIEAVNQSTPNPTTDSRWSSVAEVVNYD